MDYTTLLNEFSKISLVDLYRLHVAIGNELNNPMRLSTIKQNLRIGMELSYFDHMENRLKKSKLLKLSKKTMMVFDFEQQKKLAVPYQMVSVDSIEAFVGENVEILNSKTLKVGDYVGFNLGGIDIVGMIRRLNDKTVTLVTESYGQRRIAYPHLYRTRELELAAEELLQQLI